TGATGLKLEERAHPVAADSCLRAEPSLQNGPPFLSVCDVRVPVEIIHHGVKSKPRIGIKCKTATVAGLIAQVKKESLDTKKAKLRANFKSPSILAFHAPLSPGLRYPSQSVA